MEGNQRENFSNFGKILLGTRKTWRCWRLRRTA